MSERSGLIESLQVATTHALVDTYYDTTNELTVGVRCNSLRLYVASGVSSPGSVSFRLTINNPGDPYMGATTYYDYCTDSASPETFGPLIFTGADETKMLTIAGIDLVPLDVVQISYAASANAAGATVAIIGESFHSDLGGSDISTGDIEVDVAALEVLQTAANALLVTIDADTSALVVDLAALEVLVTAGNVDLAAMEALLITIDADTSAMATDLAAVEALLITIDADTSAIATDIAALEVLSTAANAILTTIDTDTGNMATDLAAIEVLITDGNVDLAAIEVLITSGNALLTTIDADTSALVVDLAAIEVLITSGNAILTTIDVDTGNIATSTAAAAVDLAALEVLATAANVDLAALEVLVTAGNVDLAAMEVLLGTIDADTSALETTVTPATTSLREEEISPISEHYLPTTILFSDEAVSADPGVSYAPDATGHALTYGHKYNLQMYLLGGTTGGPADRTVTVTVEASMGLLVAAAVRWVDVTESLKDLNLGTDSHASFTSVGAAATDWLLEMGNAGYSHVRVKYDWDGAPDATDGAIVVNLFKSAL